MSLWSIFIPHILIHIFGVFTLLIIACFLYLYVLYAFIRHSSQRWLLTVFIVLTAFVSSFPFLMPGRPTDYDVVYPLSLLMLILFPLAILLFNLLKKTFKLAFVWSLITLAGLAQSYGWAVLIFAFAKS